MYDLQQVTRLLSVCFLRIINISHSIKKCDKDSKGFTGDTTSSRMKK